MEEIWKDIPKYEGLYQASNLGRVKSLKRKARHFSGERLVSERILKGAVNRHGYIYVVLAKNGYQKTFQAHQLVAMAFLNHTPSGYKEVVDHIDNDKLNNRVDNLQITTNRHNSSKDKKGTSKYAGVCWRKASGKWYAQIYINVKVNYLGLFEDELEAAEAYQNALKETNN